MTHPVFPVLVDTPRKIPHRYYAYNRDECTHCGITGVYVATYGNMSCVAVKTIPMPEIG